LVAFHVVCIFRGRYPDFMPQEAKVVRTNDISLSTELHIIRAHLLHYEGQLADFEKSVVFIQDTPNPTMNGTAEQDVAMTLLTKECGNLLSEIARLEMSRSVQNDRLRNLMDLVSLQQLLAISALTHETY
jgi:hypothetical protein